MENINVNKLNDFEYLVYLSVSIASIRKSGKCKFTMFKKINIIHKYLEMYSPYYRIYTRICNNKCELYVEKKQFDFM